MNGEFILIEDIRQLESGEWILLAREKTMVRGFLCFISEEEARRINFHRKGWHLEHLTIEDWYVNEMEQRGNAFEYVYLDSDENGYFSHIVLSDSSFTGLRKVDFIEGIIMSFAAGCTLYIRPDLLERMDVIFDEKKRLSGRYMYRDKTIGDLMCEMDDASDEGDFEKAAKIRDEINRRKSEKNED